MCAPYLACAKGDQTSLYFISSFFLKKKTFKLAADQLELNTISLQKSQNIFLRFRSSRGRDVVNVNSKNILLKSP